LTAHDKGNTDWQDELSTSYEKAGDAQVKLGDIDGAIASYRKGLSIAESLVAQDPNNAEWQRYLFVTLVKAGRASKDTTYFRRALNIGLSLQNSGKLFPFDDEILDLVKKLAAGQ
jgi:tetratricopeptide (TPR) repeat protein